MKKTVVALCLLLAVSNLIAQHVTISGHVFESTTGESLSSGNIVDLYTRTGTITNDYGFYSFTAKTDSVLLVCSYVGYKSDTLLISLKTDTVVDFSLVPFSDLSVVEVTSNQAKVWELSPSIGVLRLSPAQVESLPKVLGEADIFRALHLLPGIQSGNEGQTGLFVRGGSPDQNLILLDGVNVYNAAHLFGFFSVFNSDAIREVNVFKGEFPARYGGRLSSIVDIKMKEGNLKKWQGTATLGLISSKFTIQGPLKKDRTALMFSARRTYADILAAPLLNRTRKRNGFDQKLSYFFHDINLKINHKFSVKDRLYISLYSGLDRYNRKTSSQEASLEQVNIDRLKWGNQTIAMRWNHTWTPKLFSNSTLTYSRFNLLTKDAQSIEILDDSGNEFNNTDLEYTSGIRDQAMHIDFDYIPNPKHTIKFGSKYIYHQFNPGVFDQLIDIQSPDIKFRQDTVIGQTKINASEWAAYVEDEFKIFQRFKVKTGLHTSGYRTRDQTYYSWQPRLSLEYGVTKKSQIQVSFSSMAQFVQLLTNSNIGLATDLWLPATDRIVPQTGWQGSFGARQVVNQAYTIEVGFFYKEMKNVMAYKPGTSLFNFNDWQDRIVQGQGEAYGMEWLIEKKQGRFHGWIAYTLSWSWRRFEALNEGQRFPFRYDKRHDVALSGIWELRKNLKLSANWVFNTGNALTLPRNAYAGLGGGDFVIQYGERNSGRLPSYHRLDLNINWEVKKKKTMQTWSAGIYNIYARRNPFYLNLRRVFKGQSTPSQPIQEWKLTKVSLPPLIPSLSLKIAF